MANILLALILVSNAALSIYLVLQVRKVRRIYDSLVDFMVPAEEGKPSQFAVLVEKISETFARSITMQIKAVLMGTRSGEVRAEKAVQGELAIDAAEQAGAGGLLQAIPGLSRSLRKNPGLIDLALPFLQRALTSHGNNGHSAAGSAGSPKFKL